MEELVKGIDQTSVSNHPSYINICVRDVSGWIR